jgi:hypothetical protein
MVTVVVCCTGIHGMEPWLLREALSVLEGEGKVRLGRD